MEPENSVFRFHFSEWIFMLHLSDTHCHLDFSHFDPDRDTVIARAREAGIEFMLVPGTDLASSRRAVALAGGYPEVYAAVGIHPHGAKELKETKELRELRKLAENPEVVAIGEIGLDYYRMLSPRPDQLRVFQAQLGLAAELGLPVIVHNRDATQDVLAVLRNWTSSNDSRRSPDSQTQNAECGMQNSAFRTPATDAGAVVLHSAFAPSTRHPLPLAGRAGVLHSFSASLADAEASVAMGFYIGITGPITYRSGETMRHAAAGVPLERLLIETDSPFLMPRGYRGSRNEPAYVRAVAEKIAEVRELPLETVARQTTANARTLFGLEPPS